MYVNYFDVAQSEDIGTALNFRFLGKLLEMLMCTNEIFLYHINTTGGKSLAKNQKGTLCGSHTVQVYEDFRELTLSCTNPKIVLQESATFYTVPRILLVFVK